MSEPIWVSTDEYVSGPFPAHGYFRIWYEGGVYVYEARGPFNEVTTAALAATRAEAVRRWPMEEGRGLSLVRWHGSLMMPPEAFRLFARGYQQFAQGKRLLAAVAWVGDADTEGLDLMAHHFEALYAMNGTRFARFTDADEALAWLRRQV